jgi:hypothetical protein
MKVRVHRNLHTGGWSVQHKTPKGWRLYARADFVALQWCRWRVSEAGSARAKRQGRRNVHAFAEGRLQTLLGAGEAKGEWPCGRPKKRGQAVSYNPYTMDTFQSPSGKPVRYSRRAYFLPTGVALATRAREWDPKRARGFSPGKSQEPS